MMSVSTFTVYLFCSRDRHTSFVYKFFIEPRDRHQTTGESLYIHCWVSLV